MYMYIQFSFISCEQILFKFLFTPQFGLRLTVRTDTLEILCEKYYARPIVRNPVHTARKPLDSDSDDASEKKDEKHYRKNNVHVRPSVRCVIC